MTKRDTLFFFGPVFYVMVGISSYIVSSCLSDPNLVEASDGLACILYFILHEFLWCFVGAITLILYYLIYRGVQISDDYDPLKLGIGSIAGGGLVIAALIVSAEIELFIAVFLVSLVVNIVPVFVIMILGVLITRRDRIRLAASAISITESTLFRPNLN